MRFVVRKSGQTQEPRTTRESRGTSIEQNINNTCQDRGFVDRPKGKKYGLGWWLIVANV